MNKKEKMKKLLSLMGPDNSWEEDEYNTEMVRRAYLEIDPTINKSVKKPTNLQQAIIDLLQEGCGTSEISEMLGCTPVHIRETKRRLERGLFLVRNNLAKH